jgi:zinc and cadmium transporter
MIWILFIALTIATIIGGLLPVFLKLSNAWNKNLLACSGAILLSITFLHLLPESIHDLGFKAGIFMLAGFFLQLFIQKYSHGLEHGHTHIHTHNNGVLNLSPIIIGLGVHAFLEGIPLGYSFSQTNTTPSLFLGVAAHKAPEALTLMSVVATMPWSRSKKLVTLLQFALITPIAGILAYYFGRQFFAISNALIYLVPVVIGAFIHIATTIFFESGTSHHDMDIKKVISIIIGLLIGIATLLH